MAVARKRKAVKTGGAGSKKSAAARKPRSVRAQVSREEWEKAQPKPLTGR